MNIRAVLFDLYATLLEVGPPPADADADARWQRLFRESLDTDPPLGRVEFFAACSQVIARHHETARRQGVPWPEIQWPSIVLEVLPGLARLPGGPAKGRTGETAKGRADQRARAALTAGSAEPRPTGWSARDEFLLRQVQASRTIELTAGTAALLRWLRERGLPLGIVSNAQAYTWHELELALAVHGLDLSLFERELCFLSFEHGFSKPDPHVFRILTARLEARGIRPAEILMVGDRLDNDIEPARACGWQTWQRTSPPDGDWAGLRRWLDQPPPLITA